MKKFTFAAGIASVMLSVVGCSTMPQPQYVSPNTYQNYDCNQLASEYNRLTQYIEANQQSGLSVSGIGFGLGVGIGRHGGVYPSVNVGLGNNAGNRNNLAIVLGERDAIVQSARMKQCNFVTGLKLSTEK